MIIEFVKFPIFVIKIENHKEIKPIVLNLINEQEYVNVSKKISVISKTDYFVDTSLNKKYIQFLLPHIQKYINQALTVIEYETQYKFKNCWFQQYTKNDHHGWHIHEGNSWAAIYYVNKDSDSPGTFFREYISKRDFYVNAVEGDLVIFPAQLLHCSPENSSDKLKTIVAFNLC